MTALFLLFVALYCGRLLFGDEPGCTNGCAKIFAVILVVGLIGGLFGEKEDKSSAIPGQPNSLYEQSASAPKLAPAKKHESEGQTAADRVDLPTTPSRNIDKDYLVLKSTDGRTIRGEILSLSTMSVVVRRDDGLTFDIPLSILDADSKQRIETAKRSALPPKSPQGGRRVQKVITTNDTFTYNGREYRALSVIWTDGKTIQLITNKGVIGVPVDAVPKEWLPE